MRAFVTGASGFIGSALTRELLGAGHEVVGLARSDASAATLRELGADSVSGSMDDLDVLAAAAAGADGVVHLAFDNSFGDYGAAVAADLRVVEAMGEVLAGSDKPFVAASGTLALGFAPGLGTEDVVLDPALPRMATEHHLVALAERGVRSSIVRLAPCVHDETRAGLASLLLELARERGVSGYVGDGANRWPGVHRLDAARLLRLALESAPAGARLHAADEVGVPMLEIAGAIGRRAGVPVEQIPDDRAAEHFGFLAMTIGLDNPTSHERTTELLGWVPRERGLLDDLAG